MKVESLSDYKLITLEWSLSSLLLSRLRGRGGKGERVEKTKVESLDYRGSFSDF